MIPELKSLTKEQLRALGSMTKYPSIQTFHELDPQGKGKFKTPAAYTVPNDVDGIFVTEKIDGTNGGIILMPNGEWLIRSRDRFLTARGDLIPIPDLGIVDTLRPYAQLISADVDPSSITCVYGEVFGKGIGPGGNYTSEDKIDFRIFDVLEIPVEQAESILFASKTEPLPLERIALMRESDKLGNWMTEEELISFVVSLAGYGLYVRETPRIDNLFASQIPTEFELMYQYLERMVPETFCALDPNANKRPEGIVIRNSDRSFIRKVRFEDYERTLGLKRRC